MITPLEIENRLEPILPRVQKPGRYVGGEYNQVVKDWDAISTHIALIFPDIYDLGMPNLGLAILYDEINQRPDTLAERAYAPWLDMETELRAAGLPLYSLESKQPLAAFDILAFTLPYESLYTNVLNILDLAGLPLRTSERTTAHPLVIAGGHACFNPEPMSDFIDAFVVGEGEEVIHEVISAYQSWKASGLSREDLHQRLAAIPGVYVPSLVDVTYAGDGTIAAITPRLPQVHLPVLKRVVAALPKPVTRFLVPSVDVVHNRVAVEIMRGCTRGCRFCQAGFILRPVRERSVDEIVSAIEEALQHTGYEEVALLSLSSSDYTHIIELADTIQKRFSGKHLTVSLPSLRIESFSVELMDRLKELRQSGGFTLAPEAATERMRQVINKPVGTDQLMETVRAIFSRGWTSVKLYFMIGHPEETLEDVQAIIDVCKEVLREGRKLVGGRAKVHAGVSTFIPKPHTPFQWTACDTVDQILAKQDLLRRELRGSGFKLTWVDPEVTLLEAWLSRGDRRTSQVIYHAWKAGCKFDAWQENYLYAAWLQAFADCGLDPMHYSHRTRSTSEILPWQVVSAAVRPAYLKQELEWSHEGKLREDCREHCTGCGIVPELYEIRLTPAAAGWVCPVVEEK